jgi:uncharacterized protein with von Willebrand factor type A (vWA) domain
MLNFHGGGTNINAALSKAYVLASENDKWKRADVVLVTDGESSEWSDTVIQAKERGIETYGVAIQVEFNDQQKEALSGMAHITHVQLETGTEQTQQVLAI